MVIHFPRRNKREREYATAKPNKFRKIYSYFKNVSSIELNRQKSLEDSFQDVSIDDHEKNINSQEVRAVGGQDFFEWPDIGLAWSKSKEIIHSTPMRPGINSRPQNTQSVTGHDVQCQTSNSASRKILSGILRKTLMMPYLELDKRQSDRIKKSLILIFYLSLT